MSDDSSPPPPQQRSAARFELPSLQVRLRSLSEKDAPSFVASVRNLSASGVLLATTDPLTVDQHVEIGFSAPTAHPFVFKGRVVRVAQGDNGSWEAGVRFGHTFRDEMALILWLYDKKTT